MNRFGIAAGVVVLMLGLGAAPGETQPRPPQLPPTAQDQPPQAAPIKPYKVVAVRPPAPPLNEPTLEAFRRQLAEVAKKQDRAALSRLVAPNFFWIQETGDAASRNRSPFANLAAALGLDAKDAQGWDVLASVAEDPTASPLRDRDGVLCSPGEPTFDAKEFEALLNSTGTDVFEWGYPTQDGVIVRSAARADAAAAGKLGMHLVRVLQDDSPTPPDGAAFFLRVLMPSGQVGFAAAESLVPLDLDQLCYVKTRDGWRIAGYVGMGAAGMDPTAPR
jgi:hypothetical protein